MARKIRLASLRYVNRLFLSACPLDPLPVDPLIVRGREDGRTRHKWFVWQPLIQLDRCVCVCVCVCARADDNEGGRYTMNGEGLWISDVSADVDAGVYDCRGSVDEEGRYDERSITVDVHGT
jgi:hypothetical protein